MPLIELPQAQFLLMSATLGDVTHLREDLTRRTGRPTTEVSGSERPVPLHFSYSQTPIGEEIEELVTTHQAPVYVVHFTQAAALERAQALTSVNLCSRAEKDAIAEAIGAFRFTTGFGKTLSRLVRHGIGSITPACCPSTAGSSNASHRTACSRSSAAPTHSASASTSRSVQSC